MGKVQHLWNKMFRKQLLRLRGGGGEEEEGYKLEGSNMENYGGKEMRDLRKKAAQTEEHFKGAGSSPGLEIWRVENKPGNFGINRWPKDQYGQFYEGDSYIILNTYMEKESNKLLYDVHFWLGKDTTQDEMGVAAYKTVELDDLLDDLPVQHREVQFHESPLFRSYFVKLGIKYLMGGIDSGFRHVTVEEDPNYKRLFMFKREVEGRKIKTALVFEIPAEAKNLNQGDVFLLDKGKKVYLWVGDSASPFEKMEGGLMADNMVNSRNGKAKRAHVDDHFWEALGGGPGDVKPASEPYPVTIQEHSALDRTKTVLYRVSDASGQIVFKKEGEGDLKIGQLDTDDVFLVATNIGLWVWIGNKSNDNEKQKGWDFANKYIQEHDMHKYLPITQVKEDQVKHAPMFFNIFV